MTNLLNKNLIITPLIAGLMAILILPMTSHAMAARAETNVRVDYEFYTGGLHAMSATMNMAMDEDEYRIGMQAEPYGTIGKLLPWSGQYSSTGRIDGTTLVPEKFTKSSQWRDETDRDEIIYDESGQLIRATRTKLENGKKVKGYNHDTPEDLVRDTVDMMTATAEMLVSVNEGQPCDSTIPVFDGKRRFNIEFQQVDTVTLTPSRYNKYGGVALKCTVNIIPVAGWGDNPRGYFKIQETSKRKGMLPTIWLGQAYDGGPMVPVRMELKSEYGAILMHFQQSTVTNNQTASLK